MPGGPVHPQVKAMILCDEVLTDPRRTRCISWRFQRVRPRAERPFPIAIRSSRSSYSSHRCGGRLRPAGSRPARLIPIVSFSPAKRSPSSLWTGSSQMGPLRLRDCPFPEPGLYWIQFYCAGELLAEQRLHLLR